MSESYQRHELSELTDNVLIDQISALESGSISGCIATVNLSLIFTWLGRNNPNHVWLFIWLGIKIVTAIGMIWSDLRQNRIPLDHNNISARLRRTAAFPAFNGLMWCVGVLLLWEPDKLELQVLLMLLTLGAATAALLTLKQYLPALFLFLFPTLGSILVATLWNADVNTFKVMLATATFSLWACQHALTEHRRLIRGLYAHHEVARLTAKLQSQVAIADAATQAKSRFLAAASHDMRQPMHALSLYLGALSKTDLPDVSHQILTKVTECAHTMDGMFSAMLNISQLDSSMLQPSFKSFPISEVLHKIELEFSEQAKTKNIALRVVPCRLWIRADPDLLENILRNLVSNAVRYTDQGTILVGCRRKAQSVRLGVYDTGIGIAPEQQGVIFEEFFQIGNHARDRSKGLGLGLSIARRQAQLMQTSLTLQSTLGCGSKFEIALQRSSPIWAPTDETPRTRNKRPSVAGALVVLVDDESIILDAAQLLLEQWGCEVIAARSGPHALALLANTNRVPAAIISDHRLRDMETGVDVIAAIRDEFSADIPAILVTGDTSPAQFKAITSAGIPVLHKPLQSEVMHDVLCNLIGGQGAGPLAEYRQSNTKQVTDLGR